jgi:hypothetical protein
MRGLIVVLLAFWVFCSVLVEAACHECSSYRLTRTLFWEIVTFHLILGLPAVYILTWEYHHPQVWGEFHRHPSFSLPCCAIGEIAFAGFLIWSWRREWRVCESVRLMGEALRLQAEGDHEAAEAAYRAGKRLMS